MRKYPSDVSVSENCIDANVEMVERRDPDNFPRFPPLEWCAWTLPEIALKRAVKKEIKCEAGREFYDFFVTSFIN